MGTRLEMCDSRWCPLPAPLPHSKVDENTSPYMRQGMVVPVSSSSSYSSPAVSEVPSRGGGSAKAVSKSCSSSGPGESKIEPLIVFDWDDTMLTSSWIQVNELLQAGSYDDLPVEAKRDLAHLERSVIECLKNAHQLGTVIIITNAESGWVELSAARFFKDVLPLLEDVAVVSARSLFEAQFPGSPLCWKSAAFAYMMHDHFLDRPRWIQKKVVSIGDSNEEKVAMRIAAGQHSTMAAKAVKFIAGPDPEALACQLDFVTQHLASVVLSDTDVDIVLDASVVNGNYALPMHSRGVYGDVSPSSAADQSTERCLDVIVDAEVIDVTAAAATASANANANSTAVAVDAPGSASARAPTAVVAVAATGTVAAAVSADDAEAAVAASPPSPSGSSSTVVTTVARTPRGVEEGARAGSSNPIPIPTPILVPVRIPGGQGARGGGGGGGGEGGGDCVQPLLPCQIEVGGSSSSSSLCSAVGVKTEPVTVVSDDAPDGGLGGGGGGGGGGAPSEGDGACGGGFACRADGVGGEILVEIKLEGGGGVARVVEDGEVSAAAKVLDEAGAGVEEGVKGVPVAAAGATVVVATMTATGDRGGTAAAREGGSGATDAGVVVTGVVEGGQVVVKPAPMA